MSRLGTKAIIASIASEVSNSRSIIQLTRENERETEARLAACENIAASIADKLARVAPIYDVNGNRRFDRAAFMRACGLGEPDRGGLQEAMRRHPRNR